MASSLEQFSGLIAELVPALSFSTCGKCSAEFWNRF
jgi:hypothetical protein